MPGRNLYSASDRKDSEQVIRSFGILLGFQVAGNFFVLASGLPIPGNVAGMVFLTIFLVGNLISVEHVEPAAQFLVDNMAFLFVPAGVGIMSYFGVLAAEWLPLSLSIFVSLVAVLVVTGRVVELFGTDSTDGTNCND